MRKLQVVLVVAAFVAAAGCNSSLPHEAPYDAASPLAKQARAGLAGTVTLEGEADAGGVGVRLENQERVYSYTTANDGRVHLPGVVPGTYTLTIHTPYFKPVQETLTLSLGTTHDLGNRLLDAAANRVSGRAMAETVVDKKIATVGGVTVRLRRLSSIRSKTAAPAYRGYAEGDSSATEYTAVSGGDGTWALESVDAGIYGVTASHADAASADLGTLEVTGDEPIVVPEAILRPLTGFFTILGDGPDGKSERYTRNQEVTLQLSGFNAQEMKIGRSPTGETAGCAYSAAAVNYDATHGYSIAQEGLETVCVRFVDADGRETQDITGTIYYDATKPGSPFVSINNGLAYSTHPQGIVTLSLGATDAGSGLSLVKFASSEAELATAPALVYEASKVHILDTPTVDGVKEVWASFGDKAGNYSDPVSSAINLDRTAPAAVLFVPGGNLVPSNIVPIEIAADADTALMQLSNDPGLAGAAWQPFGSQVSWIFPGVQGPVSVYGRFRDHAGNDSPTYSLQVTIDTTPPVVTGVAGAVVSDTLVWDHLGGDVASYTVYLYDQGVAVSVTNTAAKRLYVGRMNPGFTVVATFNDGTQSNPSLPPGYHVPATVSGYIGLALDAPSNRLLERLASEYNLGVTVAGCGQVTFRSGYASEYYDCGAGSSVEVSANYWGMTPPPFDAQTVVSADNPLSGLPGLRVSGGSRGWVDSNDTPYLVVPRVLQWPGTDYAQAQAGDAVISGQSYNPALAQGRNKMSLGFPLAALAYSDDATLSSTPFTAPIESLGTSELLDLQVSVTGQFAGMAVTSAALLHRYYESYMSLNGLWNGLSRYSYGYEVPGSIRLPLYANEQAVIGDTLAVSSIWPYCQYSSWEYTCSNYGTAVTLDVSASDLTLVKTDPWDGWYNEFSVSNSDATRVYRLPLRTNTKSVFHWATETEQGAFAPILRRMIQKLAAPVRVRGTGKPVLTSSVQGADAMQIGGDEHFTGTLWQPYSESVTLPEGLTTVWVRYRDEAGNVTASQKVEIAAPQEAPRVDQAVILGEAGNVGYTTSKSVTAYLLGQFPSAVMGRMSESPQFEDHGWVPLEPTDTLTLTDPVDGTTQAHTIGGGMKVVKFPLEVPEQPGTYTRWFWVVDASKNYSLPISATVIFDNTTPDAEFSLKTGNPGSIQFQNRWTVTQMPLVPNLSALSSGAATQYTLSFDFPYLGTTAATLSLPDDAGACFAVGYLEACALREMHFISTRLVSLGSQQATIAWQGTDAYGTGVTTAATVFANGTVRLSYWQTGARVEMYGHVDGVETPYSDWAFALAQGSVEYRPNSGGTQFRLRNSSGGLKKIDARHDKPYFDDEYYSIPSAWRSVPVTDTGNTTYVGTAFSLAGAPGRVTVRSVVIPDVDWSSATYSNVDAAPLSDARWWLSWDQGAGNLARLARVNGKRGTSSPIISRLGMNQIKIQENYQPDTAIWRSTYSSYYDSSRHVLHRLGNSQRLHIDGRVASSGVPITVDHENRLLYGVDGSIWDLADPVNPQPLRVFAGSYPYKTGQVARSNQYLWTRTGIWNIGSPQFPTYVAAVQSQTGDFVARHGRVYEFDGSQVWIYEAAYPVSAPVQQWLGHGISGAPIAVGDRLYAASSWDVIEIDLTDPDAPTTNYAGSSNGEWLAYDAGVWFGFQHAGAGAGLLLYDYDDWYMRLTPYQYDTAGVAGEQLGMRVKRLDAAGPWLYITEPDGLTVAHAGATLPQKVNLRSMLSTNWVQFAADSRFMYVCTDDYLTVYEFDWRVYAGGSVRCSQIHPAFPYVLMDGTRYLISQGNIAMEPTEFCTDEGSYSNCSDWAYPLGPGYEVNGRFFPNRFASVELDEDNCGPLAASDSIFYCQSWNRNKIMATTMTALRYSGIVTGTPKLPMVAVVDLDEGFVAASGDYLSTFDATYFVRNLNDIAMVGPGNINFLRSDVGYDQDGYIYRFDDDKMVRAGRMPRANQVALSPAGWLAGWRNGSIFTTRWGPALPELRYVVKNVSNSRDIVSANGYVFVATADGLVRFGRPVRAAKAVQRPDVTARHRGGAWSLLGSDSRSVGKITAAASTSTMELCTNLLKRPWKDPEDQWAPTVHDVCTVENDVDIGNIFEGDLGHEWMAFGSTEVSLASSHVETLAADSAGRVYAGVLTGATGVHVFGSEAGSLVVLHFIALPVGVRDVAIDQDTLYVSATDDRLRAYDLRAAGFPLKWIVDQLGSVSQVWAGFGLVLNRVASSTRIHDPGTGNTLSDCWYGDIEVAFTVEHWSGQAHPVMVMGENNYFSVVDPNTCEQLTTFSGPHDQSVVRSIWVEHGLLWLAYEDGTLWFTTLGRWSDERMFTALEGRESISKAVMVGNLVYTIGAGAPMIFQVH